MINRLVFLVLFSTGVLASEIILTRIFTVVFWYHFGFLVLSTAMLGFGIGGFLIRYHRDRIKVHPPETLLNAGATASGLLLFLALIIITHNPFHIAGPGQSPNTIALCMGLELLLVSMALIVPFTVMGAVVLFMVQMENRNVGLVYGANLIGSAAGCLAALVLLNAGGGLNALIVISSLFLFSGLWTSWPGQKKAALVAAVSGCLVLSTVLFSDTLFPIRSPQGKPATAVSKDQMLKTDWNSLSRVDIYREKHISSNEFGLWGLSPVNTKKLPERLGVLIDYWAYTTILKHSGAPDYYDFLDNLPMYGMYRITAPEPRMLIIGSGGGMDIRAGLRYGVEHIDAVEINPSIFKAMTEDYAEYSGNVYRDQKVSAHLAEGRSFLESSQATYDIIQLSGVDTCSATQAGAFALTENYLYTCESFAQYLNHLEPDGLLSLTHWYIPSSTGYPRFSLRLFTLALSALEARGIREPEKNVFFFQSKRFAVLLVKKVPLTVAEIRKLSDLCEEKKYDCLYRPDRVIFSSMAFYSYVRATDKAEWIKDYPFNVTPPTDDSPFYFENRKIENILKAGDFISGYTRFDGQTILILLFIEMLVAATVLVICSFGMEKRDSDMGGWLYFFTIGAGFMMAEVSFSQQLVLFLGHPVFALSVVLFSILLFSGLGSLLSGKITTRIPLRVLLLFTGALLCFQAFAGLALIRRLIGLEPLALRITVSVFFLAPVSFLMGFALPEAVRDLCSKGKKDSLGIYWAFNSFASVLGAVAATILAIETGFTTVMVIAALCYVLAAMVSPGRRSA